jgi:hypothetical protein
VTCINHHVSVSSLVDVTKNRQLQANLFSRRIEPFSPNINRVRVSTIIRLPKEQDHDLNRGTFSTLAMSRSPLLAHCRQVLPHRWWGGGPISEVAVTSVERFHSVVRLTPARGSTLSQAPQYFNSQHISSWYFRSFPYHSWVQTETPDSYEQEEKILFRQARSIPRYGPDGRS